MSVSSQAVIYARVSSKERKEEDSAVSQPLKEALLSLRQAAESAE